MAAKVLPLDMSNVADRTSDINPRRLKEGDYLARVTDVKDAESKKDGVAQWVFTIVPEEHRNAKYPYYCKLQENQLWKVRNILVAAGINVPKKKLKIDPNRVVGKLIAITLEDDEYEGKEKSTIAAIFPAAELQGGDEEAPDDDDEAADTDDDDEDTSPAASTDDEEDEDEDEDVDPFLEMDRTALKAYITGAQPDFKAKKSQTDDDLREIAREVTATSTDDDDEEDEEDEPEPPKPVKKAAKKAASKKPAAVDDDDLEELDIDDV
jgi:hypothetical protein